jgi:hypothetical protein
VVTKVAAGFGVNAAGSTMRVIMWGSTCQSRSGSDTPRRHHCESFLGCPAQGIILGMVVVRDLSDAEQRVWAAFSCGGLVSFGTGNARDDDPAGGESWGLERQVRAEVLAALLSGAVEVEPGQIGGIHLERARICGKLELLGGRITHRLRMNNCYIPDGIDLSETTTRSLDLRNCHAGAMRFYRAIIDGLLDLSGMYLNSADGVALDAPGLTVTMEMSCSNKFRANGGIRLVGAQIGGELDFRGAQLNGKGLSALEADELAVTSSMRCSDWVHEDYRTDHFQAEGSIDLKNATIGGQLDFGCARLNGKGTVALRAQGITIARTMFCRELQADGGVNLAGAKITGQLVCSRALLKASGSLRLDKTGDLALNAQRLAVTGDIFCNQGFTADGEVTLTHANVGGQLDLRGAHLNAKNHFRVSLDAAYLAVAEDMLCDESFQVIGMVDLRRAKIGLLADSAEFWPNCINLEGLTYVALTEMPGRDRRAWLNRNPGYSPQPYEQLAAYYRRLGRDDEARRVLLAKERRRRDERAWWTRWWGWLQDALAGYGYAPGRALLLLACAFVAGWLVFSSHQPVPVGPGPHPAFNAALYTLDVLIPAPSLGQAGDFDPQGATLALAAGLHILGWLLAITVIAAITRSFSRT